MINYAATILLTTIFSVAVPAASFAQVFDFGPSDSSLFTTVIDLPPAPNIGNSQSIGGVDGQTTQLNVGDGGTVGDNFDANSGSEVNISGGTVGNSFNVLSGSEVNISGGAVGSNFNASSGSEVNISGGTVGFNFDAFSGSDVELIGGEFRLNNAVFTGSTITLTDGDIFTGTLSDGSVFIFSPEASDSLNDVTLTSTPLPSLDLTPIVVTTPVTEGPSGLRAGQTLTLEAGGTLRDNFAVVDATLNIAAGTVGNGLEVAGGQVNVSGGTVGGGFDANSGSEVNISGGTVGGGFDANSGSQVNISGGTVGNGFDANSGSEVNISGGTVGSNFNAFSGSEVNISGGTVGFDFDASSGSDVELIGGEFRLNNAVFTGSTITLTDRDIFTGTLSDGSVFIFSREAFDSLNDVTLTLAPLPSLDLTPIVVTTPVTEGPSGLRAGQALTLEAGGTLRDNFAVVDATLNIAAGTVGNGLEVAGGQVNVSGGTVGFRFDAGSGSEVNISGGTIGGLFASSDSEVNISGGDFGVGFNFFAASDSQVNLFGTEFLLDGELLDTLTLGDPLTITERNLTLSGLLADGSAFSFDLNSVFVDTSVFVDNSGTDFFFPDATLTVTLVSSVPEPSSLALLAGGSLLFCLRRRSRS